MATPSFWRIGTTTPSSCPSSASSRCASCTRGLPWRRASAIASFSASDDFTVKRSGLSMLRCWREIEGRSQPAGSCDNSRSPELTRHRRSARRASARRRATPMPKHKRPGVSPSVCLCLLHHDHFFHGPSTVHFERIDVNARSDFLRGAEIIPVPVRRVLATGQQHTLQRLSPCHAS